MRLHRDIARANATLHRMKESIDYFDQAIGYFPEDSHQNIKYGKLLYVKGLASKRISAEKAIEVF